jgi:hypothetical protein
MLTGAGGASGAIALATITPARARFSNKKFSARQQQKAEHQLTKPAIADLPKQELSGQISSDDRRKTEKRRQDLQNDAPGDCRKGKAGEAGGHGSAEYRHGNDDLSLDHDHGPSA